MKLKWFELLFIGLAAAAVIFTAGYAAGRAGAGDIDVTVEKRVAETDDAGGAGDGLVDLNTADRKSLMELPGIGGVLADRIIEYRDANGPFMYVEELLSVPGIGTAIFNAVAGRITV